MHNCLNKRRSNTYEISQTYEQTDLPEKLQERNKSQHQELTDSTDAWWRSPLDEKPLAQKLREALLLEEDPIQAQMLKAAYDKEIARLVEESK